MRVAAGLPDDHHDIAAHDLLNRADGGALRAPSPASQGRCRSRAPSQDGSRSQLAGRLEARTGVLWCVLEGGRRRLARGPRPSRNRDICRIDARGRCRAKKSDQVLDGEHVGTRIDDALGAGEVVVERAEVLGRIAHVPCSAQGDLRDARAGGARRVDRRTHLRDVVGRSTPQTRSRRPAARRHPRASGMR